MSDENRNEEPVQTPESEAEPVGVEATEDHEETPAYATITEVDSLIKQRSQAIERKLDKLLKGTAPDTKQPQAPDVDAIRAEAEKRADGVSVLVEAGMSRNLAKVLLKNEAPEWESETDLVTRMKAEYPEAFKGRKTIIGSGGVQRDTADPVDYSPEGQSKALEGKTPEEKRKWIKDNMPRIKEWERKHGYADVQVTRGMSGIR